MIDYEKLKECHELAKKLYDKGDDYAVCTRFNFPYMTYTLSNNDLRSDFNSINVLLEKLRKLTEPEPRYKVDDTVWVLAGNKPIEYIYNEYLSDSSCIYTSKAELIQAQIDYWESLKYPYADEDSDYHAPTKCDHDFSLKETILEGILKAENKTKPEMAEIIKNLLFTKVGLRQGDL